MDRLESGRFANRLEISQLADTLEEVEADFQAHIIEDMPDEKVADVLEEMAPDEAADLLAELPKDRSENLLELMEDDEAEDVRKLLAYPEESAGGIMTTEYVSIPPKLNAEEAIAAVRAVGDEVEQVFYVYVTDEENHLMGVFSLSDLIFANPKTPIMEFMHRRVAAVDLFETQDEVARVIAKYNLLAVPVVDAENRLQGIVTSDDALDKIIPTAWKKHLPHFYLDIEHLRTETNHAQRIRQSFLSRNTGKSSWYSFRFSGRLPSPPLPITMPRGLPRIPSPGRSSVIRSCSCYPISQYCLASPRKWAFAWLWSPAKGWAT